MLHEDPELRVGTAHRGENAAGPADFPEYLSAALDLGKGTFGDATRGPEDAADNPSGGWWLLRLRSPAPEGSQFSLSNAILLLFVRRRLQGRDWACLMFEVWTPATGLGLVVEKH